MKPKSPSTLFENILSHKWSCTEFLEFSMHNKYFIISTGIPFTATYDLKGWPDISSVGMQKPMSNSNLVLKMRRTFNHWVNNPFNLKLLTTLL